MFRKLRISMQGYRPKNMYIMYCKQAIEFSRVLLATQIYWPYVTSSWPFIKFVLGVFPEDVDSRADSNKIK